MTTSNSLILAALICLYAPISPANDIGTASTTEAALAIRIDAAIAPAFRSGEPGAIVLVSQDGQIVLRKAYGVADEATHVPLTPEMAMPIGSMTKQFTAAAVMMLVESGKLSVSAPITRYLPDYPTQGKTITIEHLLTNSSGIPDYVSNPDWNAKKAREVSTRALIDSFSRLPIAFEPGARYAYSSSNFVLLGAIIEKVSGVSYAKFIEQRIFIPLGMNNTAYAGFMRGTPPLAAGHTVTERGFVRTDPISPSQLYAAGGIVSTVDDLNRWNAAISAGKLLSAASWNKMFTPHQPKEGSSEYGYGFQIDSYWNNTKTIRHSGQIDGFDTFAMRVPDGGLYIAVLSNRDLGRTPPYQIAQKIALAALGSGTPAVASAALDHTMFDRYVGRYRMTHVPIFVDVSRSGDKYFAAATGQGAPFELKALSGTRFSAEAAGAELEFNKGEDGTIDRVDMFQRPVKMTALREPKPVPR